MGTSFSVIYYSAQGHDNTEEFSIYASSGQFNSLLYAHMQAQFLNISSMDKWGFMKLDMDIKREISELDLDSPILAEKKPISRFVILSGLVHVVAAAAIIVNNHIPENETEKDVVEIQVASAVSETSDMSSAPQTAPVAEEASPAPAAPVAQEEVVAAIPEPAPVPKPTPVAAKSVAPVAKPAPQATIDDIKTPTLDESPVVVKTEKPTEKLDTQDIDQELNKVDEQQLKAATTQIDEDTAKVEQSLEKSTAAAAEQIKKQDEEAAAQVAARAEALRKEKELEEAKAASLAAAAVAEAEKKAQAEEEAAKLAEANAAATTEVGEGSGEKNAGPGPVSSEVRSLENLRQMPGNPKPQYDQAERLRGDKGVVVFQAFVTQDGRLTDFKLLQSTGFRNLDGKTLKALKQWKFYPGQEGWVELPFDWNLKGGPQEKPAYLRRKVGQGN